MKIPRPSSLLIVGLAVMTGFCGLLLSLPYFIPLERVQQAAAAKMSALTGQDVTFSGAERRFSLPLPYFVLRNVQVAGSYNGPALLRAPRIEAEIAPSSLFGGEAVVSSLTLVTPKIALNTDVQNRNNWRSQSSALALFDPHRQEQPATTASAFSVGTIKIKDGTILYTDDGDSTRLQFDQVNLTLLWPDIGKRFSIRGTMTLDTKPMQFSATLARPAALFQRDISPFEMQIDSDALKADIRGEIFAAQQMKVEAVLKLSSPSLRELAHFAVPKAKSVPELGKIDASAKLRFHDHNLVLDDTRLRIGNSSADGFLAFRTNGPHPFMQGTLDFDTLDLRPFFERQIGSLMAGQGWSTEKIEGENLSTFDMDLRLSAKTMQMTRTVIEDAALSVLTRNNRFEISLGDGKLFNGQMSGRFVAESRTGGGVKTYGTLALTDIRIDNALRELFGIVHLTGTGELSLDLNGEGATANEIVDALRGEARVRLNDGSFAGLDLATLLQRGRDKPLEAFIEARQGHSEIESANARFILNNGVATTDDAHIEGPGYRILLSGKALLAKQSFDMKGKLAPPLNQSQDFEFPFAVTGPWFNPSLKPSTGASAHPGPI